MLGDLPLGFLIDATTLADYGVDHRLVHKYVKRGWLAPVVRGLYRRPGADGLDGSPLNWRTVVQSLALMDYPVHVGGMSALAAHGLSHYLSLGGAASVQLFGDAPTWLQRIEADAAFDVRSRKLLGDTLEGVVRSGGDSDGSLRAYWRSEPERAILEALDLLPSDESFHNVDMVFEALSGLRPALLNTLLAACQSVKVKRLFFVFADRHAHAWRKYVPADDKGLGTGSRELVKGGRYHPEYHISLPPEFVASDGKAVADGP